MLLKLWLVHTLAQNYVPYERLRTTVQPSKGEKTGTLQTQVDFSRKNTSLIYNERSKTPLGDTPWRSGCQQRIHKSKCRKQAFLPRTEMQQEAFAYLISLRHSRHHRKSLAICLVIVSYTQLYSIFVRIIRYTVNACLVIVSYKEKHTTDRTEIANLESKVAFNFLTIIRYTVNANLVIESCRYSLRHGNHDSVTVVRIFFFPSVTRGNRTPFASTSSYSRLIQRLPV